MGTLRRMLWQPMRRAGHRGAVLFWIGLTWLTVGGGVLIGARAPWPSMRVGTTAMIRAYEGAAVHSWAMWLACGTFAIVAALTRSRYARMDWLGYAVAVVPAALTFFLWCGKVLRMWADLAPEAPYEIVAAVMYAVAWMATAGVVATVASWPEPAIRPAKGAG